MAVLLVVAAACGTQSPVPADKFYRLALSPAEPAAAGPLFAGVIEVQRLAGDGLMGGRSIVYSTDAQPNLLKEYHYHFWTEPPIVLLRDQLVTYLRQAGVGTQVVTPSVRAEPDYVLTGKVMRFEKVAGENPRGVVQVELGLRETGGKLLLLDTYGAEVAAADDSVPAAVAALNAALGQVCAAFARDLAKR
jgi:cholesterol transport system auxiliary component